jgi:hypothetical protein
VSLVRLLSLVKLKLSLQVDVGGGGSKGGGTACGKLSGGLPPPPMLHQCTQFKTCGLLHLWDCGHTMPRTRRWGGVDTKDFLLQLPHSGVPATANSCGGGDALGPGSHNFEKRNFTSFERDWGPWAPGRRPWALGRPRFFELQNLGVSLFPVFLFLIVQVSCPVWLS